MAETFVTLTFLSAICLTASVFTKYGKWLSGLTGLLSILSFIQLPSDSIQQEGGAILVSIFILGMVLQYNISIGANRKVVNGIGGIAICLLLLNSYPKDGVAESIYSYTFNSNLQEFIVAILIGFIIGQMLVNITKFNQNLTFVSFVLYLIFIFAGLISTDSSLFLIITSGVLFGLLPYFETLTSQKVGSGEGRTLSLGLSTLLGILIIFILTYYSVKTESRIGSGSGATAVALWLTLAVSFLGLVGMLLPLTGLDHHPRPEAWGFRICISLSPMLLTFQTDLSNHVILGVIFAILISISAPMVLEKKASKPTE